MLVDKIGDLRGKITSQRVIDATNSPKIEFNVSTVGTFRDIEVTELHTYVSITGFDGIPYGQTNGIIMTKEGSESIGFTGHATGYYTETAGKMRYIGSIYFKVSSSTKEKLAFLNNVLGVFENDIDELNNSEIRIWEWK
ncbi:MAG: hypothetical protein ACPKPY_12540 [Nitrososphaeraceae archaeon]